MVITSFSYHGFATFRTVYFPAGPSLFMRKSRVAMHTYAKFRMLNNHRILFNTLKESELQ